MIHSDKCKKAIHKPISLKSVNAVNLCLFFCMKDATYLFLTRLMFGVGPPVWQNNGNNSIQITIVALTYFASFDTFLSIT